MSLYIGIAEAVQLSGIPRATITRWLRASDLGVSPGGNALRRARSGDLRMYPTLGAVKVPGRHWQFNREVVEAIGGCQGDPLRARAATQRWLDSFLNPTAELESPRVRREVPSMDSNPIMVATS